MKASIVDLRYKMRDILKALERGEKVIITSYGKERGVITPSKQKSKLVSALKHTAFGMWKDRVAEDEDVMTVIDKLRASRY